MESIVKQIQTLKQQKNAVILAHYYTSGEIQEIADYVGDSFYLAKIAKGINADVIVFCGVKFMGESAKILNMEKTVLMPDITADCPMAHMVQEGLIDSLRKEYQDLAVVCYVNSVIDLKCQSDICVTSSNAVKIVKALPNKNIFFIPDENLGRFVAEQITDKNVILNKGFCPRHKAMKKEQVELLKKSYPSALVLAHPECTQRVLSLADYIGSTAEIIDFAKKSDVKEFIICTEVGILYKLQKDSPSKKFYFPAPMPVCEDMKKITLEKVLHVLKSGENEIVIDKEQALIAKKTLDKMLEIAK